MHLNLQEINLVQFMGHSQSAVTAVRTNR